MNPFLGSFFEDIKLWQDEMSYYIQIFTFWHTFLHHLSTLFMSHPTQGLHGSAPCPLHIYYSFQVSIFTRLLSVWMSRYLIPMPSLRLFSFCWFVFPVSLWWFLSYLSIFCLFLLLLSLRNRFISNEKQKEIRNQMKGKK